MKYKDESQKYSSDAKEVVLLRKCKGGMFLFQLWWQYLCVYLPWAVRMAVCLVTRKGKMAVPRVIV